MVSKKELMELCKCDNCTLRNLPKVPLQIPERYQWNCLFVGQAPGGTEGQTGVPFTGAAGKMLFRLMTDAGLSKKHAFITNLVCCPPPGDREPTDWEKDCCWERLKEEVHKIKPDLIVALGKPAFESLTGLRVGKMEANRGQFFPLSKRYDYDCLVLSCFHPSFVMRQRQWIDVAVKDFKLINQFFTEGFAITQESPSYNFTYDPDPLTLHEFLSGRQEITIFDLETTGLNPFEDEILGIAFAIDPETAMAVYLRPGDNRAEVIARFLADKGAKKGAQNGSFDYSFNDMKGWATNGLAYDTRLAEILIHPDLPKDLQSMRAFYTKINPYKPTDKEIKKIKTWPKNKLLEMACMDVITTFKVMQEQKKVLSQKELELHNNHLIKLIPCTWGMEKRGVLVDIPALAGLYSQLGPKADELALEITKETGINPNSPVQICEKFNLPSSNKDHLEYRIKRQDPNWELFERILEYRQYNHAATNLKGIYSRLRDGRIHTSYAIEGAGTGRLASKDPNLQNVPDWLRVIYIPDSEEYTFCEADFSQLELRTAALIAPEPILLEELTRGIDIHENLRKEIFGGEEKPRQRLITKAVVFGTFYGRSPYSIAREFGVEVREAERWQTVCINRFPGLVRYKKRCDHQVLTSGYVETPFGRRRNVTTLTQGYNTPNQSTAADVGLHVFRWINEAGFDLRLTVYDSLLIQVKKGDKPALREIKRICETPFEIFNGYSFPVKIKTGPDWYNLKEVEV